jgi:transposase
VRCSGSCAFRSAHRCEGRSLGPVSWASAGVEALRRKWWTAAPELRAIYGVGPDTAATLLTALGDNPNRIGSDAAFAKLCGVSPLEASSGKTIRHRLNRGGNRDANRALHVILVVRMRRHGPTRDYFARRLAEGKTKNEIMRCIKRYIAREVYHAVREPSRRTNELIA